MSESNAFVPMKSAAIKKLIDDGIMPPMCTHFELVIEPNSLVRIKAECYATEKQIGSIRAALDMDQAAVRGIARSIIFRSMLPEQDSAVKVELPEGIATAVHLCEKCGAAGAQPVRDSIEIEPTDDGWKQFVAGDLHFYCSRCIPVNEATA